MITMSSGRGFPGNPAWNFSPRPLSRPHVRGGLFFVGLGLALTLSGCGEAALPDSAPVATHQAPPTRTPTRTPTPELTEQAAFSRPSIRRGEPLYQPRRRRAPVVTTETPPAVAAEAVAPVVAMPSPTSAATAQLPPVQPAHSQPNSYPTAKPAVARSAPSKSESQEASSSQESEDDLGVFFEFSDEIRAKAIYAPVIAFDDLEPVRAMYANKELTVRFDVSPNGRFKVRLVEGTGDAELDGIALETLRQWRWRPKTVRRRPVGSIEILTLHARVL